MMLAPAVVVERGERVIPSGGITRELHPDTTRHLWSRHPVYPDIHLTPSSVNRHPSPVTRHPPATLLELRQSYRLQYLVPWFLLVY